MSVTFFNPYADGEVKGAARRIEFLQGLMTSNEIACHVILGPAYRNAKKGWFEQISLNLGLRRLGYFLHVRRLSQPRQQAVVTEVIFSPTWRDNVFLTVHDLKAFDAKATRGGSIRRWAYLVFTRLASKIVVVSKSVQDDLVNQCGVKRERIHVIPNGISAKHIAMGELASHVEKSRDFIYVSSFAPHKRHTMLLRAAPPGARVCLVGRDLGSLADIQAEIHRRAGDIQVEVMQGVDSDQALFQLIGSAHCGIFPSVFEGFGIPILEYAACGVYVLASDIPPFRELAEYIDKFVPADDERALGEAMHVVMENRPASHASRAKRIKGGSHTDQAIAQQFISVLGPERATGK